MVTGSAHDPKWLKPAPPDWVRVACWQSLFRMEVLDNAKRAGDLIHMAAERGVQLIVFPELFLHGYSSPASLLKARGKSVLVNDREALRLVGAAARSAGVAVVMGYADRLGGGGEMYNAVKVWHADGTVAFSYRKVFLYGQRELALFAPGTSDGWRAFQLRLKSREVRCGVCICADADSTHPEVPRRLADAGAAVLFIPCAALSTGILDLPIIRMDQTAFLNQVIVLRANMACDERYRGGLYCGGSSVADKNGMILDMLGKGEHMLITQVQLSTRGSLAAAFQKAFYTFAFYFYALRGAIFLLAVVYFIWWVINSFA